MGLRWFRTGQALNGGRIQHRKRMRFYLFEGRFDFCAQMVVKGHLRGTAMY